MKQIKLMQGDNILSLKKLPENSIDSIILYRHIRLDTNETFYVGIGKSIKRARI